MKKAFNTFIMIVMAVMLLSACAAPLTAPQTGATLEPQQTQGTPVQTQAPVQTPVQTQPPVQTPAHTKQPLRTVPDGSLHLYFLPVGDADACVAISPEGYVMVVDTALGETYSVLREFLQSCGIKNIDYVVLTHGHKDHIGGMQQLIEDFGVGTIYMPESGYQSDELDSLREALAAKSLRMTEAKAGVSFDFGTAKAEFLTPIPVKTYDDENEWSAVMRLSYNGKRYLLAGDALKNTENDMADKYGADLKCDLLKCGHHGEKDATKKSFIELTKPSYAVISAGDQPDHADQKVFDRLRDAGTQVFCTKTDGIIHAEQKDDRLTVTAEG